LYLSVISNASGRFGTLKSDSTHHFFRNACTKSGSLRFSVFWLLTDFVCLYTYEFWLSLCKIVRCLVILLLPLLDIFPLISLSDIFSINRLRFLKIIGQCDIKHIMMLPIKIIMSILKVLTDIITSITAHTIAILVIISVSTFQTAVILYFCLWNKYGYLRGECQLDFLLCVF
jgi:hypothetical protein